jgi:hypothetical protein
METNPTYHGIISRKLSGVGAVTRAMINERTRELAFLSGRLPMQVTQADYEQAKRELSGGPDLDPLEEALESIPESERWNPVPGSTGTMVPEPPSDEEDGEGRNESAQLVEEGIHEAEHDQMLQAEQKAQASEKRDRQGR